MKTVSTEKINQFLSQTLDLTMRDYCPNGLQVEGKSRVKKIATGVTASLALIEAAIKEKVEALFVHHGLFWSGDDLSLVGMKKKRVELLIKHKINLYAIHLPLDVHETLGNNALLGKKLGLEKIAHFGERDFGWLGRTSLQTVGDFEKFVAKALRRKPLLLGNPKQKITKVAWCTGAAQKMLMEAKLAGADLFLSGEVSEQTYHEAKELGISYLACGHHATEKFGIEALGKAIAKEFHIEHRFINIENPV